MPLEILILTITGVLAVFLLIHEGNHDSISYNVTALRAQLEGNLFGQPLAMEVCYMLQGHIDSVDRKEGADKSLSISMHGWPGTGKNYVAEFIAKSLFKEGMDSQYVKLYIGRNHFPDKTLVSFYQSKLKEEITVMLKKNSKALIIFDEVNDIPAGVLDVLKPFMDHHRVVDGVNYRNVVFLFLSNVGGNEIAKHFVKLNKDRDSLVMADFDEILREITRVTVGGFDEADVLYFQLIDHFIPFLPLERHHVVKCVEAEFKKLGKNNPTQAEIDSAKIIEYKRYVVMTARLSAAAPDLRLFQTGAGT